MESGLAGFLVMLAFLFGIFVGAKTVFVLDKRLIAYENAIKICEEELPRNKQCEITGKLKEK